MAGLLLRESKERYRDLTDGDSVWIAIWDRVEPLAGFRGRIPLPDGARLYER